MERPVHDPSTLLIEATRPSQDVSGAGSSRQHEYSGGYEASIPRSKPLSPGEILGCTAPRLSDADAIM